MTAWNIVGTHYLNRSTNVILINLKHPEVLPHVLPWRETIIYYIYYIYLFTINALSESESSCQRDGEWKGKAERGREGEAKVRAKA